MTYRGTLYTTVCFWLFGTSMPSLAAEEGMRELVLKAQASERLIASAIEASDLPELVSQVDKAIAIAKSMLTQPGREAFVPCISASTALSAIARTAGAVNDAAAHLEFRDRLVAFTVDMDICEERLGLPPSRQPNLGRAPR